MKPELMKDLGLGSKIVKNLKEFAEKYQFPKMHKIIAHMLLAAIRIRHEEYLIMQSVRFIEVVREQVSREIADLSEEDQSDIQIKMFELSNVMMAFSWLSDEHIDLVVDYCEKMIPENERSLEQFLSSRFKIVSRTPHTPLGLSGGLLAYQAAAIVFVSGFSDEKFTLFPAENISNDKIIGAIVEYYESGGLSLMKKTNDSVGMDKDGTLYSINISNHGDSVQITVLTFG